MPINNTMYFCYQLAMRGMSSSLRRRRERAVLTALGAITAFWYWLGYIGVAVLVHTLLSLLLLPQAW